MMRWNGVGAKPAFFATHWLEPHAPYLAGKKGQKPWNRYLAEVDRIETSLRFIADEFVRRPDLARRTYVVLAADHGEAFGEHGSYHHASTLYDELLRVPLLILGPGIAPSRDSTPVSLIDVGPTVLDLFGLGTPGFHLGQSLLPALFGKELQIDRPMAAEAGRLMRSLVFADGYKAIVDLQKNTQEVYDLASDPGELRNLVGTSRRADLALVDLHLFFEVHRRKGYEPPWREF
jgi:arylsulfatase A-like enzyme